MSLFAEPDVWGPDETIYRAQALTVRNRGLFRGLRTAADRFLSERSFEFPSPIRWLWIALTAATAGLGRRAVQLASLVAMPFVAAWAFDSWLAGALAMTSPLVLAMSRRALQDVPVALALTVAVGCALTGNAIGLGVAMFVALGLKEATVLYLPAVAALAWMSGTQPAPLVITLSLSVAAWAVATRIVVGKDCVEILRALKSAHNGEYTEQVQSGAPHRLLVDLTLCSPLAVMAAVYSGSAEILVFSALCIAAHAMSPVRNVRTIIAVDVALRAAACSALSLHPALMVAAVAIDLAIFSRIKDIYDPTTAALTRALRMA